ncbi:MAG: glycosyltransferase [Candidatus Diapherotrites archaeon]|nr:glycosyltransferase [Candidatus Diapherotrites archaeon]
MSIIIPVLNERSNISRLVERIEKATQGTDVEIIFVDGGSTDGTVDIIKNLSARDGKIRLLSAGNGIVGAVAAGLLVAKSDKVIIMDGDLQHPPEKIPEIVEALGQKELVIASRYIGKGAVKNWKVARKIASKWAAVVTRMLYPPARHISDPLSGFLGVRKKVVSPEEWPKIGGFKVSLLILHDVAKSGGKIAEIPYSFMGRKKGRSKMGTTTIIQWFILVVLLAWKWILHRYGSHGTC